MSPSPIDIDWKWVFHTKYLYFTSKWCCQLNLNKCKIWWETKINFQNLSELFDDVTKIVSLQPPFMIWIEVKNIDWFLVEITTKLNVYVFAASISTLLNIYLKASLLFLFQWLFSTLKFLRVSIHIQVIIIKHLKSNLNG